MKSRNSQSLDVLEILQAQHAEVDDLIAQLEAHEGDVDAIFAELADKLAAHATVEETIFYPAVFDDDTSDLLHEAVQEHLGIKRVLADLLELDACDEADRDAFEGKLAILKDEVSRHAHDEEEQQLFPILRESLDADERAALGNEVLAMFEMLMDREPRNDVFAETEEAAPLPG